MRSISLAFVAAVVAVVVGAAPARAQTCTAGDPETCNADGDAEICDGSTGQIAVIPCDDVAAGSDCAPLGCDGVDCPEDSVRCTSARGGACRGVAVLFDGDDANDGAAMAGLCAAGSVCQVDLTDGSEACLAPPAGVAGTCTAPVNRCVGDAIVICLGFGGDSVITTPGVIDCGDIGAGFTCVQVGEGFGCQNPDCGAGGGTCDGTTAITCTGGAEDSRENCATFGEVCVQDEPSDAPRCVTADPECGPTGQGVCAGTTATICAGGQFQSETNCAAVGLVCGAVAGTGRIGCIEPGAAEGEGEGEGATAPECERDSDCDDDEECNDGECEEEDGPVRGGGGTPIEPAPVCAEAGTLPVSLSLAALVGLLLRRRRAA